jgi:hypothetical protein
MHRFALREADGSLQVILGKYNDSYSARQPSLLNIPLKQFGPQLTELTADNIVPLPPTTGRMITSQFVGTKLLYVEADTDNEDFKSTLLIKDLNGDSLPITFDLEYYADRIEPIGSKVVVMGAGLTGLGITSFDLVDYPLKGQSLSLPKVVDFEGSSYNFKHIKQENDINLFALPVMQLPEDVELNYSNEVYYNEQMRLRIPVKLNTHSGGR